MFRKRYLTLAAAILLFTQIIVSVHAAPSLSLGSTASYNLNGKLQVNQSCTSDPVLYASQACLGISSISVSRAFVTIVDDSHCSMTINDPFSALRCRFIPDDVTVSLGGTVVWTNNGNLTHTVTANVTANDGLPSFDSGPIPRNGGVFSQTFTQTGTYHYYDSFYTSLLTTRGIVNVSPPPPPPPPPTPTSFQVDLSGTVGWNVEGLSDSQANLNVSHQISVSVSPIPGITLTPVTESGSFEQSINLSTRVESPGTATGIVRLLLMSLLPALSGATLGRSVSGPVFQTMLSSQSNSPEYTEWWVNGPLSNGSPVQIFQGWSSVTGSENLNLGGGIGTRSAWIVTSQLSQTVNVNIPSPSNPFNPATSNAAISLKFLWSYDKSADLLLRNSKTVNLTIHSTTPMTILVEVPCSQGFCTNPIIVTVTRDMAVTLTLAMRLSSTNLKLPATHPATPTSSLMDSLAALPWMPFGLAGAAAAGLIALSLWLARRARRAGLSNPALTPSTTPPAPPATTPAG